MGNIVLPMWADCPAVTRLVLAGYPAVGVAVSLIGATTGIRLGGLLTCSLWAVFGRLEVWTLFLSSFYFQFSGGMSFLMLLLELFMGMQYLPSREREMGSSTFLLWLVLVTAATNLIFLAITALLCVVWSARFAFVGNDGLWTVILALMSMKLLGDPSGSTSFWGFAQIPNKWYPLFFVGLFSLLNGLILWDQLAAIALGYLAFWRPGLTVDRLLPSHAKVEAAEKRCCFPLRGCLGGVWLAGSGLPTSSWGGGGQVGGGGGQPSAQVWGLPMQSRNAGSGKFTVFSGTGNRLGEAPESSAPARPAPPVAPPAPAAHKPAPAAHQPAPTAAAAPAMAPAAAGTAAPAAAPAAPVLVAAEEDEERGEAARLLAAAATAAAEL